MYKLCKTEQSARRQRELEQVLARMMLTTRYEEITVSDFCAFAGIPRKAFYRYFSSKDGVLHALIDHTMMEYEQFRDPGSRADYKSMLKEMEHFYQFWLQQKWMLDALKFSGLSGILLERAIGTIDDVTLTKRIAKGEDEFSRRQIARFAISGLMIMIITWHHDGYRESPREMAEQSVRMLNQPLMPFLEDLI